MYSYQVPPSYTVNVSIAATPTGLADYNTNSIAIFTNDPAGFSESYQAYMTPNAVSTDFGSDSLTYAMANALFTPVPNLRTGGGYVFCLPLFLCCCCWPYIGWLMATGCIIMLMRI